jgi:light-regulated signal transduction histidine kinase (bacteriophytochrome)
MVHLIGRHFFSSVDRLTSDAEKIASGDLDHPIHLGGSREMHSLAQSLERMRQTLTEMISRLELSNKDLEQYAYVVSHDLQEPLRKILAFGSKIEETPGTLDENSQFYLSRVLEAASRMRTLIDDLLTYARVTQKNAVHESVDLNRILENVWSDLELTVKEKQARLKYQRLPLVKADPIQMQQLFQNLVHNALKFSRAEETPVVEVLAEPSNAPGWVDFKVKDNGIGFAQKYADRIMAPFQRLHSRSEYSGTGIGLAVCNKIISKHGGRLRAQSSPGFGSEFSFSLPGTSDKAVGI